MPPQPSKLRWSACNTILLVAWSVYNQYVTWHTYQTNTDSAPQPCFQNTRHQLIRHSASGPNTARNLNSKFSEGLGSYMQELPCTVRCPNPSCDDSLPGGFCLDSGAQVAPNKKKEGADCFVEELSNTIRICDLEVADGGNIQAVVYMLRPLHIFATDVPWTHLSAQQLAHQMEIRWPLMESFMMRRLHDQHGLGLEIISQLVQGTWTELACLSVDFVWSG